MKKKPKRFSQLLRYINTTEGHIVASDVPNKNLYSIFIYHLRLSTNEFFDNFWVLPSQEWKSKPRRYSLLLRFVSATKGQITAFNVLNKNLFSVFVYDFRFSRYEFFKICGFCVFTNYWEIILRKKIFISNLASDLTVATNAKFNSTLIKIKMHIQKEIITTIAKICIWFYEPNLNMRDSRSELCLLAFSFLCYTYFTIFYT